MSSIVICLCFYLAFASATTISLWQLDQSYTIEEGYYPDAHVSASLDDKRIETGWATLEIKAHPSMESNPSLPRLMGIAEGYLTSELIENHSTNFDYVFNLYGTDVSKVRKAAMKLVMDNYDYLVHSIASNPSNSFWQEVDFSLRQIRGIHEGAQLNKATVSLDDLLLLNAMGDVMDLVQWQGDERFTPTIPLIMTTHCTLLAKILNDKLTLAHTTFAFYPFLTRIYKYYSVPYSRGMVEVQMSSYAGSVASVDDFYVITSTTPNGQAHRVTVSETSLVLQNATTAEKMTTNAVLTNLRTPVALRVAGASSVLIDNKFEAEVEMTSKFIEIMKIENSGSYNNQWVVARPLLKSLVIAEQVPGNYYVTNVDDLLLIDGYFGGVNIAYDRRARSDLGYDELVKKEGDNWDYWRCPRSKIIRRDVHKVKSVDSLQKFMNYNDYKNDPLSKGSPSSAISARFDLDPKRGVCGGGYDSKISVGSEKVKVFLGVSQSSPSTPKFSFQDWPDVVHIGIPDEFDWCPVEMKRIL
ncbi:hypothetical protein P9112_007100 [Eukaryota sp. TZLM1-RC]